jgi:hypothetical protein
MNQKWPKAIPARQKIFWREPQLAAKVSEIYSFNRVADPSDGFVRQPLQLVPRPTK